mmetsp:Transcript_26309/g.73591  ORF Transcript_26309/g.73591 Transcript_26309/m.73591 type:complete len:80 (+) Transcript_26309:451-690(+)
MKVRSHLKRQRLQVSALPRVPSPQLMSSWRQACTKAAPCRVRGGLLAVGWVSPGFGDNRVHRRAVGLAPRGADSIGYEI